MRKKKEVNTEIPLTQHESPAEKKVDVRQQAVDEMMQRIKKGVQLRPVNQSSSRAKRPLEKTSSNSAIQELKGIMENFNRSSPRTRERDPDPDSERDSELKQLLLKRRDALETQDQSGIYENLV